MKPTDAVPGKPYVLKMKRDEDPLIFQWLNMQGIYSDSIRYLIEKEIAENGLRNLQHYVPSKRNIQMMKEQLHHGHGAVQPLSNHLDPQTSLMHNENLHVMPEPLVVDKHNDSYSKLSQTNENLNNDKNSGEEQIKPVDIPIILQAVTSPNSVSEPKIPRKAGKNFGEDVLNSYK
ncbi:hypothetical protein BK120_23120 [Paenibacillus sp. FSL A5-0031]|uniref:hypothetical protein n=1 Tax=Paenibacillus sp. FSL A5-0031 TaxID=1920420 RepID=UPI00096E8471|nr:hypothetical protein [Paenibacillus sp. FSL A5-0031]OME78633.1 hypothetical protein BK120_23120 [Paenibacillus sp. FSL A5-0031]